MPEKTTYVQSGKRASVRRCAAQSTSESLSTPLTEDIESNVSSIASVFPSGEWKGYYAQYGSNHSLCGFNLIFHSDGRMVGSGVDDVGQYTITGIAASDTMRLAFTKKYIAGSTAANGYHNGRENKGHKVEYRGERVSDSLSLGFRGKWYVRLPHYNGEGPFHLWPAMPDWQLHEPSAPPAEPVAQQLFVVSDVPECVVCFDRQIDSYLTPCRHLCMCQECASSVMQTSGVTMEASA